MNLKIVNQPPPKISHDMSKYMKKINVQETSPTEYTASDISIERRNRHTQETWKENKWGYNY